MKIKLSPELKRRNAIVDKKAKTHKVKVVYKYADEIYVDRPRPSKPVKDVINARAFRDELIPLCIKHLKKVKKSDLPLAICQIQDNLSFFHADTKERILKGLKS